MINDLQRLYEDLQDLLLVNSSLRGNLVSLSPIIFDDSLKTTSASIFIADFNLLSLGFDSFTFKLLYCVIFILITIKPLYDIVFTKLSFASSRMK